MVIGEDAAKDRRCFHVTEQGVVLVTQDMLKNCSVLAAVPDRNPGAAALTRA
jgi:hypothetical protein